MKEYAPDDILADLDGTAEFQRQIIEDYSSHSSSSRLPYGSLEGHSNSPKSLGQCTDTSSR